MFISVALFMDLRFMAVIAEIVVTWLGEAVVILRRSLEFGILVVAWLMGGVLVEFHLSGVKSTLINKIIYSLACLFVALLGLLL